ncbi:MAG: glycosyltransferase family 4 protein [Clostridiales bacterium]|nr:glycosyltransferase family 4 protein [Clostridiales bacterium]
MRILFHIHALPIGGAERQLTYLVKGLVARGWDVHVVTLYAGGQFWEELEGWGGCALYSLDRANRWDFSVIVKLESYIKKHDIDLVQGWGNPCNIFAALASKWSGKPMLMAIRSSNMEHGFGGRMYMRADPWVARWMAKKIIFNSFAGYDYHLGLGYPGAKCMVVSNGLTCPADQLFPKPFSHDPPWKIGMISRLDPMKDHVMMFEAMHLLLQQGAPVDLHLYGDGKEDWKRHLTHEAEQLEIVDQVHWHGFTDDVWSVLAQMDIISSSSYGEGMSNTLLESMMAGRAVVATDVGDSKRMLHGETGRCGMIVPTKDAKAMAEAIATMLQDQNMAVNMANKAREVALERYSIDAMLNQYEHVFSKFV